MTRNQRTTSSLTLSHALHVWYNILPFEQPYRRICDSDDSVLCDHIGIATHLLCFYYYKYEPGVSSRTDMTLPYESVFIDRCIY